MAAFTNLFREMPFAEAMTAHPVTLIDVGARGGFEPSLLSIAFATDAVGFEPDPDEHRRLDARPPGPWRSRRVLPLAIGAADGVATLHIAEAPESSSLLEPVPATGALFGKTAYGAIVRTEAVTTATLDSALSKNGIGRADYLKLDIEGLEDAALRAAPDTLARALAIKVEVGFMPFREGQPLAHEIAAYLTGAGFTLMDLVAPNRWRIHGHVIHPDVGGASLPYSRGQLAHGDYLFFRQPNGIADAGDQLRAAWIAMAHGYFDHAERLLCLPDARRALTGFPMLDIADALAASSRAYGRRVLRDRLHRQVRGLKSVLRSGVALSRR